MTRRATRQLNGRPNISFLGEFRANFRLIVGRFPVHVVNLIHRSQRGRRIAMAINAPFHQKRVRLEHQRHLVHRAMACRTTHSLTYMNAVIEIGEFRKPVNFHPLNRFARAIAFPHRFQVSGVVEQNRVAIHTGLRGRDSGRGGSFNRSVTVAAINSVIAHVMFVAELHRLLAKNVLPREIRRTSERQYPGESKSRQENRGKQTESRDEIRAAVKNLGHVCVALWRMPPSKGRQPGDSTSITGSANPES